MSFLLKVDKTGGYYTPTETVKPIPVYVDEKKRKLLVGYVYERKEDEVLDCGWENDPAAIQRYDGVIELVSWGGESVVLCSDLVGCEKLYYYHGDHFLLVSDDFWDMIREIRPGYDDLEQEHIRERLMMGSAFSGGETIIKGMSVLSPATRVEYDIQTDELRREKYQYCRFTREVTDIQVAAKNIGEAMDRTLRSIKERYGDVTYGLGLSGGLDSRLVLHYALKNGMKVRCFNICKKRPNGVLTARSVRLARKIAALYSVPLTIIEWDPKQIDEVKATLTRRYPDGPSQESARDLFKYVPNWEPDFDVMLTGGMGATMMMFALHFFERDAFTTEDAVHGFEEAFLYDHFKKNFNKGMHLLFGTPIKEDTYRYGWEKRLFFDGRADIRRQLIGPAEEMRSAGLSYLETIYNLGLDGQFFLNCNGAFETMFGRRPSHTIYSSYVLKQCLRCTPDMFSDRALAREAVNVNLPEARQVAEEGYKTAPGKSDGFQLLRKGFSLLDRVLRGDGSHIADKYCRSREVWQSFEEDMDSDGKWFRQIVGTDIPLDEVKRTTSFLMTIIWDTKRLLDVLETEGYMSW